MITSISRLLNRFELLIALLVSLLAVVAGYAINQYGGNLVFAVLGLLVAGIITVVVVFNRPAWGASLIIALAPFEGSLEIAGQSAVRLATLFCVGVIAARVLFTGKKLVFDRMVLWTLVLVGWGFMSILWSFDQSSSLSEWISFALQSMMYLILINLVASLGDLKLVLWGHVLGGAIFSISFINTMIASDFLRNIDFLGLGVNMASRLIGLNLLISLLLYQLEKNRLARVLLLVPIVLAAIGVIIALSRGTWLGVIASLGIAGVVYLVYGKLRVSVSQVLLWSSIIFVTLFALNSYILDPHGLAKLVDRFQSGVTLSDSAGGRFEIWRVAWNVFLDSPLWGHGFDTFPHEFSNYVEQTGVSNFFHVNESKQAHNAYIKIITELGLIGMTIFAAILIDAFKRVWSLRSEKQLNVSTLAWGLALFVFLFVATIVDSSVVRKYFWYTLSLMTLLVQYWRANLPAEIEKLSEDTQ